MNVLEIKFSVDARLPAEQQAVTAIFFSEHATLEEIAEARERVAHAFPGRTVRTYQAQPAWRLVQE